MYENNGTKPGFYVKLGEQGIGYSKYSLESQQETDIDDEDFVVELNKKSKQLSHVTWLGIFPLLIFISILLYNSFNTQQITKQPATDSIKAEITNYAGLNIRRLPNTKSPVLRSTKYGDTFPLLDSTNIKWLKIALHDSVGYISRAFSIIRHDHTDAVIEDRTYLSNEKFPYECAGGLIFFLFFIAWLNKIDRRHLGIAIFYDIDESLAPLYGKFPAFFAELANSAKIWQHTGTQPNLNLKRNGGAVNLIKRVPIAFISSHKIPLRFFITNVQIPNIKLQNSELFFLPERLLIKYGNSFVSVLYKKLKITALTARFIENEAVPRDAQVVDRTWQHINKKGGPDLRYANNRQLSICAYSDYHFSSTSINEVISTSRKGAADNFANLLLQIGRIEEQSNVHQSIQDTRSSPIEQPPVTVKIEPAIITPPTNPIAEVTATKEEFKEAKAASISPYEIPKDIEATIEVPIGPPPVTIIEVVNSLATAKTVAPIQIPIEAPKIPNVIDVVPGDVKLNLGISIGFTTPTNFTSSTNHVYQGYNPDDYKLGSKYKSKLNLNPQEVIWLNKFMHYINAFNGIEGCAVAVINLYLTTIKIMVRRFANEPVGLQQRLEDVKNAAYKFSLNQPNPWGYYDHSQVKESTEADLYYTVYKKAESAVREAWESGRNISPAFNSRSPEAIELFKRNIEPALNEVILELIPSILPLDEATEIELNQKNSTRWKHQFERAIDGANRDAKTIAKEIHHLAKLNKKNPSVENIYYEAAKFMASVDKVESLQLYLYYIKFDQKSARIDNKPLNKTNQKELFKTPEQQAEFQTIVEELIVFKDIKQSLKKIAVFYEPKRKRITLDNSAIAQAGQELSGTVDVLSKYLIDEEETDTHSVSIATQSNTAVVPSILNVLQLSLLDLFQTNNFKLSPDAVTNFAQQHVVFKNQLVESINDACMDALDDVLIDESEEGYSIDPDYFRKIYPE